LDFPPMSMRVRLVVFLVYAALPIADKSVYTKNCLG
jgi:hypothetical protein